MLLPPKMQAARFRLIQERPYLASALWALQTVEKPGLGTMAVDRRWRLYYDPAVENIWSIEEIMGILYHQTLHMLRDHANRLVNFPPDIANIAADAEINDDILAEKIKLPEETITPEKLGLPPKLLAEEYAEKIMEKQNTSSAWNSPTANDQKEGNIPQPAAGRCGSIATGQPEPWELPDTDKETPGISSAEQEIIRKEVATAIKAEASKDIGAVPAHLTRWAEEKLKPKINWRKELASVVRNAAATISGMVDYSYSRPSRRQSTIQNVVLPFLRQPTPSVAVVVDTSGSMSDNMLSQALAEIDGILKSMGLREGIKYIACDYNVHVVDKITNIKQINLKGGGGTNMEKGIEAAAKLKPRPNICVVLTDGYTSWPDNPPPKMKIIIGLINNEDVEVPRWAKKVVIKE
ncbi:von willebrand factor type A [Thermoanaerobacter kivui]|uniref:von willebrand factor type A n=1 Tax=Thermoanaerobacter kivui TaxID=2325 RepID=A0A097AS68_THEKI|nr:VWA-like domain-containing protein [Thermoanaerobacter kivui]AIS52670.1 von willebrand factor type A [Thermoanaerobacter kivui]